MKQYYLLVELEQTLTLKVSGGEVLLHLLKHCSALWFDFFHETYRVVIHVKYACKTLMA